MVNTTDELLNTKHNIDYKIKQMMNNQPTINSWGRDCRNDKRNISAINFKTDIENSKTVNNTRDGVRKIYNWTISVFILNSLLMSSYFPLMK